MYNKYVENLKNKPLTCPNFYTIHQTIEQASWESADLH